MVAKNYCKTCSNPVSWSTCCVACAPNICRSCGKLGKLEGDAWCQLCHDVLKITLENKKLLRGSDGWKSGINDALRSVRAKLAMLPDLQTEAYTIALQEVENSLLSILENGGPLTSELD